MLVAEVRTRAFLASLVPIIVNTVLNEHQLVLDIVAFVQMGHFPRSRLGEKQRGKILASWVSRKMHTIAQFGIRDPDAVVGEGSSVGTVGPEGRRGSAQSGNAAAMGLRRSAASGGLPPASAGAGGSSLRHAQSITDMPVAEEPHGIDETQFPSSNLSQRPHGYEFEDDDPAAGHPARSESRSELTPTREQPRPLELNTTLDYSPVTDKGARSEWDHDPQRAAAPAGAEGMRASHADWGSWEDYEDPYNLRSGGAYDPPPSGEQQQRGMYGGTRGYDDEDDSPVDYHGGGYGSLGGGLRVANSAGQQGQGHARVGSSGSGTGWEQDALRSMNLGR